MSRRWLAGLLALALLVIACKAPASEEGSGSGGPPPPPVNGVPSSMLALGDSITAAFGSCLTPSACPRNSWSTGEGTQVLSHYRRILALNPQIKGHASNLARSGATAADLAGQVSDAVGGPVDYVTVLIGANDACRGEMTPVATFRSQVGTALTALTSGMPDAHVIVVSLPNVYRVWEIGHDNRVAVAAWRSGACPNLLANPTSMEPADVSRRQAFADQIFAYNVALAGACAGVPRCRFVDISGFAFELTMLSAIDFFHPNAAGQQALADATYTGTFL
jgi:lysophospholipase L1-like esterase